MLKVWVKSRECFIQLYIDNRWIIVIVYMDESKQNEANKCQKLQASITPFNLNILIFCREWNKNLQYYIEFTKNNKILDKLTKCPANRWYLMIILSTFVEFHNF